MRINKFIAQQTSLSRRSADAAISEGRVLINSEPVGPGSIVSLDDEVELDGKLISNTKKTLVTLMLNKPAGYVCSRNGQGSKTIYGLLPNRFRHLNSVGRLDKNSSGLLLLTNDGNLANKLSHPSFQKEKIYEVKLDRKLSDEDIAKVQKGIRLEDGLSKLQINELGSNKYEVRMSEGRNRQIRRTFEALNSNVKSLHRTKFGDYALETLPVKSYKEV